MNLVFFAFSQPRQHSMMVGVMYLFANLSFCFSLTNSDKVLKSGAIRLPDHSVIAKLIDFERTQAVSWRCFISISQCEPSFICF